MKEKYKQEEVWNKIDNLQKVMGLKKEKKQKEFTSALIFLFLLVMQGFITIGITVILVDIGTDVLISIWYAGFVTAFMGATSHALATYIENED